MTIKVILKFIKIVMIKDATQYTKQNFQRNEFKGFGICLLPSVDNDNNIFEGFEYLKKKFRELINVYLFIYLFF